MADYMGDIAGLYQSATGTDFDPTVNRTQAQKEYEQATKDRGTLDFTDMLSLMVAQFQNQTIDSTADTSDMMNQLTQMTTMQAMNEMTAQMKELSLANVMSYSRSLLDADVVVGVWKDVRVLNDDGSVSSVRKLEEVPGKVIGVGTYNGQQVIFLDDNKMYYLNEILAIGRLPTKDDESNGDGTTGDPGDGTGDGVGGAEGGGDGDGSGGGTGGVEGAGSGDGVGGVDKSDRVETTPDDETESGGGEEGNEGVTGVDTENAVG